MCILFAIDSEFIGQIHSNNSDLRDFSPRLFSIIIKLVYLMQLVCIFAIKE